MPPSNEQSPGASPAAYKPPQHLLSSTGLSRVNIIAQYEEFCHSLQHAERAPELVFERLVANLAEALRKTAQEDLARATHHDKQAEKYATALVDAPRPSAESSKHIYLQFWFSSCLSYGYEIHVRAAATATPVPYGTTSGWPGIDSSADSAWASHGHYDGRTDRIITTPTLPTTITRVVHFENTFPTLPKVLVWLTGLSAAPGAAVVVKATANDVTETGFTLQISSGDGAALASVGAAWTVWPQIKVKTGSVNTVAPGGTRVSVLAGKGSLGVSGTAALVAICAVDLVLVGDLWVELVQVDDQSGELFWVMSAGPLDATVYSTTVGYATH